MALRQHDVTAGQVLPANLSPPRSRRRASLRAIRTQAGVQLGFNARKSHQIVDVVDCPVLRPELQQLLGPLRSLLMQLLQPGKAAGIEMTLTASGTDLVLADLARQGLAGQEALAAFADAQDLARLSLKGAAGIDIIAERRPPELFFGKAAVTVPPAAFTQATADGEAALIAAVCANAAGPAVADLFCGIGTFALPLAAKGHTVLAVDAAGSAVQALARASPGIRTAHRDLYRRPMTSQELARFDSVVLDPPRSGAQAQTRELAGSPVPRIIMVSCNPNSFARDARILLDGGYRLDSLLPVGQFLWSTHVELVACFARG